MISRTAENCFWLLRYLERIEGLANLILNNIDFILDVKLPSEAKWLPLIAVTGQESHFREKGKKYTDDEGHKYYLIWSKSNPSSLISNINYLYNCANQTREYLTLDIWQNINILWILINKQSSRNIFKKDRHKFLKNIIYNCQLVNGLVENTLLHDQGYFFMRTGMMLERINQTSRFLDLQYVLRNEFNCTNGDGARVIQLLHILKCSYALDSFSRKYLTKITNNNANRFLLYSPEFPRSIYSCALNAKHDLEKIVYSKTFMSGRASLEICSELCQQLAEEKYNCDQPEVLHQAVDEILGIVGKLTESIHNEFFMLDNQIFVEQTREQ